ALLTFMAAAGVVLTVAGSAIAEADLTREMPRSEQKKPYMPDDPNQSSRRTPPRPAIEACKGKKEGTACTINSQDGILDGLCLTGIENIFACRPNRNRSQDKESLPDEVKATAPRQRPEQVNEIRQQPEGPAKPENPPAKQLEKVMPPQPSINQQPPVTVLPPAQAQNPPHPQPENSLPQPQSNGFMDTVRQNWGLLASLVIAILAAGVTWYALFRHLTLPLRRLRKVTQQLAGGNLSARVGEGLVHRKNEIADLGRDVDRMAERIESLVSAHQRLIRDVSHELRSPLARLSVALELARQSAGPAHSAPFDRIERESYRLNELISQLLTLTKLESDSARIARENVDLSVLFEEIAVDVDYEASSCNRTVKVVSSTPVNVTGNRELLRQALENVVRNAVRYTADGTAVELTLASKKMSNGIMAVMEIRDHGSGVPESELANIFRPFYRVSDGRERESGGTGVGLAITERAVHLHGGNIKAENAVDGGLIVRIEIPIAQ
ncbi:MAG: ATP-binding protein, partial [Deltaproteobacteria bacterium]